MRFYHESLRLVVGVVVGQTEDIVGMEALLGNSSKM